MGIPKKEIDIEDLIEEPGQGHNSLSKKELLEVIGKVEHLLAERAATNDDIKDLYAVAKSKGLDPKTIKKVIKIRAQDAEKRREEEELLDLYLVACGLA